MLLQVNNFRQRVSSNLHFRQFNGSKTRIVDKVEMRNLSVLFALAASNCFQSRQLIGSNFFQSFKKVQTTPNFFVNFSPLLFRRTAGNLMVPKSPGNLLVPFFASVQWSPISSLSFVFTEFLLMLFPRIIIVGLENLFGLAPCGMLDGHVWPLGWPHDLGFGSVARKNSREG